MVMLSIYLCACLFMWTLMHIILIGVRVKLTNSWFILLAAHG